MIPTGKHTRNSFGVTPTHSKFDRRCIFCEADSTEALYQSSTFNIDSRVRGCALQLHYTRLLAKLSAGDLLWQEAQYHAKFLVSLYNRAKQLNDDKKENEENVFHGIALAQLVAYLEESHSFAHENPVVFRLAELADLYIQRLQQLGVYVSWRVHSTY